MIFVTQHTEGMRIADIYYCGRGLSFNIIHTNVNMRQALREV